MSEKEYRYIFLNQKEQNIKGYSVSDGRCVTLFIFQCCSFLSWKQMLFTIKKMFPENTFEQYMEHCFSGRFVRKPPRATGRLKDK